MITGSKELIRDINSHLVLAHIVNHSPISRAALAKELGLTKATISAIVQELLDKHLVLEIGSKNTKKGRKPILLTFAKDCGYVISLDISPDHITVFTCNLKGENCHLRQHHKQPARENVLTLITAVIRQTLTEVPTSKYGIIGISLGIHGVVHNNEIVFSPYYQLEYLNLAASLEETFQIPVFLENEANLSVLGEQAFHHECSNMINLSIHSGIGMGIMIDNRLYKGADGYAGEFGHTIIIPDGLPCPCGNHGCIEQYASIRALLQKMAGLKGKESVSMTELLKFYYQNDPDALTIIDEFVRYISWGINNILNTFNPDMIIINSDFTTFLPELTARIESSLNNRRGRICQIVPSRLQETAALLGGATVCIKGFLGIDVLGL